MVSVGQAGSETTLLFLNSMVSMSAISLQSWTILKLPTLPLYMLSQILYGKTKDVGKKS
jgi:hypothetical protein